MVIGAHDKNTAYLFNAFHCLTQISITLFSAASGLSLCTKKIKRLKQRNHTWSGQKLFNPWLNIALLCDCLKKFAPLVLTNQI